MQARFPRPTASHPFYSKPHVRTKLLPVVQLRSGVIVLIGVGIPEYEAKRYEGRIKKGGILISVHCDDSNWTHKAKIILQETGAEDVSSTGEARADFAKSDKPLPRRRVRSEL